MSNSAPIPPVMPSDEECCNSGCDPCIFDWYQQELARYRAELEAWEKKQAQTGDAQSPSAG